MVQAASPATQMIASVVAPAVDRPLRRATRIAAALRTSAITSVRLGLAGRAQNGGYSLRSA